MKVRNKKTGEVVILIDHIFDNYKSLTELNEEWEDYEEPKEPKEPKDTNYWCIDSLGKIEFHSTVLDEIDGTPNNAMTRKIIGNYFDTREEAEKAVRKLKAWKRLKDKKFRFRKWRTADIGGDKYYFVIQAEADDADKADLDLLFGGGE